MAAYKDKEKGTWYVSFRYENWKGEKVQKMKRGFRTKKEALQFEQDYKRKTSKDFDMSLGSFVHIYFEDKKGELKQNSIQNKRHMIETHVLPYFQTKKMNEIKPGDIIQWQNAIHEKGYKPTYERMLQNQLNALFNHAQRIYNLQTNPCKKVRRMGKSDADGIEFWTKDEYDSFICVIDAGSEDYLMFEILFWTGIREGELLALTADDFDMEHNLLHISKTYKRMKKQDVISTPKTENSVRTIVIPEFLKKEVADYLNAHYGLPHDERIFPIIDRTLQKRFKKYQKMAELKEIRVHDLRHSHVAYLIHQGVEPLIIKERLGHKDIRITLNTYGHLYPSKQEELAQMLNQVREEGEEKNEGIE